VDFSRRSLLVVVSSVVVAAVATTSQLVRSVFQSIMSKLSLRGYALGIFR
jgi:hypothetical protein